MAANDDHKQPAAAGAASSAGAKPRRCPVCGAPAVAEFRPFCSARCQDVDLHRWFSGTYAIPGRPGDEDEDEIGGENP